MTPDDGAVERAYRAMLLETMNPCRELPRVERRAKREADRRQQRWLEDRQAEAATDHGSVAS